LRRTVGPVERGACGKGVVADGPKIDVWGGVLALDWWDKGLEAWWLRRTNICCDPEVLRASVEGAV
jgi:hypothetical protein